MCLIKYSSSMRLLICAAMASSVALGQSLSITRKGETNYWIEASAPMDNPYTLQASSNLLLWADIHDPVQGQYSSQLSGLEVSQRYFRLVPSSPLAQPIIVMLLGDSMTADGSGWGSGMYGYFKPNATVINYAMGGSGTKMFLQSAEWDKMLLVQPNYVTINYGLIDDVVGDPQRSTTLQQFHDNLTTIAQAVRSWGGVPIFVTMHAARVWDTNGKIVPSPAAQARNGVTKAVAAEMQAPLIDLYQLSTDLLNQLGPSGAAFMENPVLQDVIHLSSAGAVVIARLVVNALPDSLGPYLTGIFDPPPVP
jgi:lysophospholipase L1-like esterase